MTPASPSASVRQPVSGCDHVLELVRPKQRAHVGPSASTKGEHDFGVAAVRRPARTDIPTIMGTETCGLSFRHALFR